MIADSSKLKCKYKLGVVEDTTTSLDGIVRSATLRYCNVDRDQQGKDVVTTVRVKRSIQRLVLIMPVEELSSPIVAEDNGSYMQIHSESGGVALISECSAINS